MRPFTLLLLAACSTGADTDTLVDTDVDPQDTPTDTPADDPEDSPSDTPTDPPADPCSAQPFTMQIGHRDGGRFTPFTPGGTVRLHHGGQGDDFARHLEFSINVAYSPELVRVTSSLTDVETGLILNSDRVQMQHNFRVAPPVLGEPWACVGIVPTINMVLDPNGMDDDAAVYAWHEVCGRTVRLDIALADLSHEPLGSASMDLVLAPRLEDGDICP